MDISPSDSLLRTDDLVGRSEDGGSGGDTGGGSGSLMGIVAGSLYEPRLLFSVSYIVASLSRTSTVES